MALTGSASRTEESPAYVPGEVIVKFKSGARQQDRASTREELDAVSRHTFRSGAEHWILGEDVTVEEAIDVLAENPDVLYAEPNTFWEFTTTDPNDDHLFSQQWALQKIEAPDAWDLTTGRSEVVIAIMDTGIEGGYLELAPNMWSNDVEVNGDPNVDDDGNGYVDDVAGWDVADDDNDPRPTTWSHGTSVAGIIGAHAAHTGGFGVAGINWSVRMMNLRLSSPPPPTTTMLMETVDYAVDNGAHIINYSGGRACPQQGCSQALEDTIAHAAEHDVLFVTAAGNNGADIDGAVHPGFEPASYDLDNIIAVAMSDPNDMAVYAEPGNRTNYGAVSVDLAAPGIDVLTVG
ncbi:MAG TPA: S8 family serine peptidase, partial [Candidatus Polarisedimenticolia bacterium]|nr:S8 family serine peptidase [Candidatus Polarisedimenticolia bacterium]